jgi:Protein of unknown function (DUF2891)
MPALPPCSCSLATDGDPLWPLLADTIFSGITAGLDHDDTDPGPPDVFGGSYDYHSCIHAHWAFLSLSRTVGDTARAAQGLARLTDTVLNSAWTFLQSSPRIPSYRYGWFVLLLSELSQHPSRNTASLQRLRATVEQTLCRWLQANAGDISVIDQGQHTSWLFAFLLLQVSAPTAPNVLSDMTVLYGSTVAAQRAAWRSRAVRPGDFMHVPSIIETLDLLRGQAPWLTSARVTSSGGLGATGLSPGHEVGERITHAWPVAVLSRTDPTMCSLLQGFVRDWRAQPTNWQYRLSPVESLATAKARFAGNSHWTPQFLWMAMRLRCPA